jgi:hypothetical protein
MQPQVDNGTGESRNSPSSNHHHFVGSSTKLSIIAVPGVSSAAGSTTPSALGACSGSIRLPLFVEGSARPQFGVYRTDVSEGRNAFVMSNVERGLDDRTTVMVRPP